MHPLRQIAAVFQEESHAASAPVAVALASIAGRLERLADEDEAVKPWPEQRVIAEPIQSVTKVTYTDASGTTQSMDFTEPPKQEKPDAKDQDQ
jgi:hypothetical protein